MTYRIPLFDLNIDESEERAVIDVLRSRWISMGPRTAELEAAFALHVGAKHAVAVSSCTAALHLALAALGVGSGDEVIVPSLTFVATVNAVGYVGATPVFADVVGPGDLSIDPEHVAELITSRTKAILPMHYAGFPCNMTALMALARQHGLILVEDAAHAPATLYDGRHAGTFGDAGCFSFFSNKNVSCGEGGMVVSNRDDVAERVRLMRSHGMTTLSYDRSQGHATKYDVVERGYNYRMDDLRAAIALAQLKKLPADTKRRAELRQFYIEKLLDAKELSIPYLDSPHVSSHYIFPVLLRQGGAARRDVVRAELADQGVETSVHYPPAHRFAIYSDQAASLPKTDFAAAHEITLPLSMSLTEEKIEHIVRSLTFGRQRRETAEVCRRNNDRTIENTELKGTLR